MERDYRLEIENIEDHIAQLCDSRMEDVAGIKEDFCVSRKVLRILAALEEALSTITVLQNVIEDCKQYTTLTVEQEGQSAKYPLCPFPSRSATGSWFCSCEGRCKGCFVGAMKAENDES